MRLPVFGGERDREGVAFTLLPDITAPNGGIRALIGYSYLLAAGILAVGHVAFLVLEIRKKEWEDLYVNILMAAAGFGACGMVVPFVAIIGIASGSSLVLGVGMVSLYTAMSLIFAVLLGMFLVAPSVMLIQKAITVARKRGPRLWLV
ncbi:hypothetical protein HY632_05350 [Candidatus Uhrbacteria bacterium]|nr:hypothetical protein [Candidatus Uhrbacteria bacterium]